MIIGKQSCLVIQRIAAVILSKGSLETACACRGEDPCLSLLACATFHWIASALSIPRDGSLQDHSPLPSAFLPHGCIVGQRPQPPWKSVMASRSSTDTFQDESQLSQVRIKVAAGILQQIMDKKHVNRPPPQIKDAKYAIVNLIDESTARACIRSSLLNIAPGHPSADEDYFKSTEKIAIEEINHLGYALRYRNNQRPSDKIIL
eukprot:s290_g27.t1